MKLLTLLGIAAIALLGLTACQKQNPRRDKPAVKDPAEITRTTGGRTNPGDPTIDPNSETGTTTTDPGPIPSRPPVPPPPPIEKEVYAVKIPGRAGFVTDPNDKEGRPLDVRGMPPGTRIESPFSGAVLLVPPQ